MDPARYQRLKSLFDRAAALPKEQRGAMLDRECADDADLRREVEELLAEDEQHVDGSLDRAVQRSLDDAPATEVSMPESIGRYRVRRVCGIGGMGTVYEAEQDQPARRVAVKVIHATSARPELLRRFRREAEILGRLQHPGIAQIFEAGEFEQNAVKRPFFAMEFVEGPTLLEFVQRHEYTTDQRVDLFLRVCEAVQHAHQHGVVHRDLKPDNVLVVEQRETMTSVESTTGQPKVLDFGVARLVDSDEVMTMATADGQLVGSLPYMSPEQASGDAAQIDVRCDVYALGVVLFELLSGRMPYEVSGKPLSEAVRVIRHVEPTRLGTVDTALRGDLETIVGRCLEKEPARRYASVWAIADDLRRFRESLPIQARPPSAFYQLRKFARRHRALVAGTLATVLALAVGLVFAIVFALRAAENERLALRQADRANVTAAESLVDSDPLAARDVLDRIPATRRAWEWRYLDSRMRPTLLSFGEVFARSPLVALDEGAAVLCARDATRACVWNANTGEEVASYDAPAPAHVWGFSRDGARMAVGLADGRVFVGERAADPDWQLWRTCKATPAQLQFSPDGRELAIGTQGLLQLGSPTTEWRSTDWQGKGQPILAFSPVGDRIAMLPLGGSSIWIVDTKDLSRTARRFDTDSPRSLCYTRDGRQLVLGTYERSVRIADPATTNELALRLGHTRPIRSVDSGVDGVLASASADGTVRVWQRDGSCSAVAPVPGVTRVRFLSTTRLVAAANGKLHVLDLDQHRRRVLRGHNGYVYEVGFSADGARVVSNSPFHGASLITWEAWSGNAILASVGHWKSSAMVFDANGNVVTGQGVSRNARPWYLRNSPRAYEMPGPCLYWGSKARRVSTGSHSVAWSESQRWRTLRLDYGSGTEDSQFAMHADGERIATERSYQVEQRVGPRPRLFVGSTGGDINGFDGDIGDLLVFGGALDADDVQLVEQYLVARRTDATASPPTVASAELLAHFRADANDLEVDDDGHVLSWRAHNDASLVLQGHFGSLDRYQWEPQTDEHPARVKCANHVFAPRWFEAALPAAADRERVTVFWAGRFLGRGDAGNSGVFSLHTPRWNGESSWQPDTRRRRIGVAMSRSADGRRVARGGVYYHNNVFVRDTRSGEVLLEIEPDDREHGFWGVSLHPNGNLVACGCNDGHLEIWDIDAGTRVARRPVHTGVVYSVAWSPDGARIATGGNDNSIRLWDAETLAPCIELRGHDLYIKALAWSPDGTMLASASGDATVRLWDSVPANERHAQLLALHRLERDVRPQVEAWLGELGDAAKVGERIREEFAADEPRRMAAFTVLARTQRAN